MALRLIERRGRLYVSLLGQYDQSDDEPALKTVLSRIHEIYHQTSRLRPDVDVRVLLPEGPVEAAAAVNAWTPVCVAAELGAYIGHPHEATALADLNAAREAAGAAPVSFEPCIMPTMTVPAAVSDVVAASSGQVPSLPQYGSVVVGGTFDRLHAGHKLLLSAVGLVASRSVAIGVTGEQLLRNKTAGFLIESCDLRKVHVSRFLESVKPSLRVTTSTLTEPVGVAGTMEGLDCIVVSDETAAGGHYCNRLRVANGLSPMEVVVVPTVEAEASVDSTAAAAAAEAAAPAAVAAAAAGGEPPQQWDGKISSSSLRVAELGRFRGEAGEFSRRTPPSLPYVIGIAGGIASGKSTVMRALASEAGAATLDADEVAHLAYEPGTECFRQVVAAFGEGVVGGDGRINRRQLGSAVFGDAGIHADDGGTRRRQLERIVWPAVERILTSELEALKRQGHEMVAMEAAVLLEAGWDLRVDEVWCLIAPPEAQVTRVMERNQLSRAAAEARIAAQMGNEERVRRSHVLLMSREKPEQTARTVVEAWRAAERRARADDSAANPRPTHEVDADAAAPLRERFASLIAACAPNASPSSHPEALADCTRKWWRILHDKHTAGGRHYHALQHLRDFHTQLRKAKAGGALATPEACELALFFHDAIYDATRHDNELRSAQLFTDFCADLRRAVTESGAELPPALHLEQASGLILRTANHMDGPASGDMAAFLDCDLHTLGASPPAYHRYAENVRLEYAHVPEADYRAGRTAVLRSFLDAHESLYFTPSMRDEREAAARANLAAEIGRLQSW